MATVEVVVKIVIEMPEQGGEAIRKAALLGQKAEPVDDTGHGGFRVVAQSVKGVTIRD